jgi:RNA polymerase sigma-70 factor (ECF subfamily)
VYDSALVSTLTIGEQYDDDDEGRPSSLPGSLTPAQAARVKRLVVEHHGFVWRSLVRLGVPRSDAEDVMQQVFMVTTRRIDDIRAEAERSFLYGVCIRMASRARRTRDRRREVDGDGGPERVDPGLRPDEQLDRAEARALLETILAAMPLDLRTVFTLYELEQVTMIEIAQVLGVPQGTVASRLRRARAIFAEHSARIEAKLKNSSGDRISGFDNPALWTSRTKEET